MPDADPGGSLPLLTSIQEWVATLLAGSDERVTLVKRIALLLAGLVRADNGIPHHVARSAHALLRNRPGTPRPRVAHALTGASRAPSRTHALTPIASSDLLHRERFMPIRPNYSPSHMSFNRVRLVRTRLGLRVANEGGRGNGSARAPALPVSRGAVKLG